MDLSMDPGRCDEFAAAHNTTAQRVRDCEAGVALARGNMTFSPFAHWFLGGYQNAALRRARDEARAAVDGKHALEIAACSRLAEVRHFASPLLQARAKAARARVAALVAERAEKAKLDKKWDEGKKLDKAAAAPAPADIVTSGESWFVTGQSATRHVQNEMKRAHAAAMTAGQAWTAAEASEAQLMRSEPGILHKLKVVQRACEAARDARVGADVAWRKAQHDIEVDEAAQVSRDQKVQMPLVAQARSLRQACAQARSDDRRALESLDRCHNNLPVLDATGAAERAEEETRAVEEDTRTDAALPERPTGPAGGLSGRAWAAPDLEVEDVQNVYATGGATGAADAAGGGGGGGSVVQEDAPKGPSALDRARMQLQHVESVQTRAQEVRENLDLTMEERGHLIHDGKWGAATKMGNMTKAAGQNSSSSSSSSIIKNVTALDSGSNLG
jgi:hypothetical protein